MKVRAQIGMVLNLDKCIGCHTCSVTCKNVWTSRPATLVAAIGASAAAAAEDDGVHVWSAATTAVGMRRLACTAERWTYAYLPTADDDQQTLSCVATVPGLKPIVQTVRLDVDCT